MATQSQIQNFIAEIAPLAQKAYQTLGKVKPSICIGMACVESAYGTSKVMRNHNAFLGFKVGSGKYYKKYWDGTYFNARTSEEYTVGTHTVIKDNFRSYKNAEQCIFNFYELLNSSLYARVLANVDYKTQMQQIKLCGYMTSSTEVNSVLTLISKYNLTQYDTQINKPIVVASLTDLQKIGLTHAKNFTGIEENNIKKAKSMVLQRALNLAYNSNLKLDGIFGEKSKKALGNTVIKYGDKSCLVTAIEIIYYINNINPNGLELPGVYGEGIKKVTKEKFGGDGLKVNAENILALLD